MCWIDAKIALPKNEGDYLVMYNHSDRLISDYLKNRAYNWGHITLGNIDAQITHWMPLPEPPKQ